MTTSISSEAQTNKNGKIAKEDMIYYIINIEQIKEIKITKPIDLFVCFNVYTFVALLTDE